MSPYSKYFIYSFLIFISCVSSIGQAFSSEENSILISDSTIERGIREILKKPAGNLTKEDLLQIKTLNVTDPSSLKDLKYCSNLESFTGFSWKTIPLDLTPLFKLTKINTLRLENWTITDIAPISNLRNLIDLKMARCQITDISTLSTLKNLKKCDLSSNQIENIDVMERLEGLEELNLENNHISNIDRLSSLRSLVSLNISGNQIENIVAISDLHSLKKLNLTGNEIQNFEPLLKCFGALPVMPISNKSDVENAIKINFIPLITRQDVENVYKTNPCDKSIGINSFKNILPKIEQKGILVIPSAWNCLTPLLNPNIVQAEENSIIEKFWALWNYRDLVYKTELYGHILEILSNPSDGYLNGVGLAKKLSPGYLNPLPAKKTSNEVKSIIEDLSLTKRDGKKIDILEDWNGEDDTGYSNKKCNLFIYAGEKVLIIPNKEVLSINAFGDANIVLDIANAEECCVDLREKWIFDSKKGELNKIGSFVFSEWFPGGGSTYHVDKWEDFSTSDQLGDIVVYARERVMDYSFHDPSDPEEDAPEPVDSPYYLRRVYKFNSQKNEYFTLREDRVSKFQDDSKSEGPVYVWKPTKEDRVKYYINK